MDFQRICPSLILSAIVTGGAEANYGVSSRDWQLISCRTYNLAPFSSQYSSGRPGQKAEERVPHGDELQTSRSGYGSIRVFSTPMG
jgi:hypothetical protein